MHIRLPHGDTEAAVRTISYKRDKLILNALLFLILAAVGVWMAMTFHRAWMVAGYFFALIGPIGAFALIVRAMGDCVALRFDSRSLEIHTLWSNSTVLWSDVQDIQRVTTTQTSGFGLVKQDIAHNLVIVASNGRSGQRKYEVDENLLAIPRDTIPGLIEDMAQAWLGKRNATPTAPQRQAHVPLTDYPDRPASHDAFDPDAALARYVRNRGSAEATAPPRPQFGRRGL